MGGALSDLADATHLGDIDDFFASLGPLAHLVGNIAGFLGAACGLLALVPGLQFLAAPAIAFGVVALATHYYATVVRTGNPFTALFTKDVVLDAVGLVGGAAAYKAGQKALAAAKASGSPTRTVRQLVGEPREMTKGYFQLARESYPMSQAEFQARVVQYHGTAMGNVSNAVSSPDTYGDVDDWVHGRWVDPTMGATK